MLEIPWDQDLGGQGVRVVSHLHQQGSDLDCKNGPKPLVSPPIQSDQRRGHRIAEVEIPGAFGLVVQAEVA
jgi:hypothetical protein